MDIYELLIFSLDNPLSEEEAARLEEALKNSEELRNKRKEFEKMRNQLSELGVSADPIFVDQVMEKVEEYYVQRKTNFSGIMISIFPRAVAACILVLLAVMIGLAITEGSLSPDIIVGMESMSPEEAYAIIE
jgi:hypothetical protein